MKEEPRRPIQVKAKGKQLVSKTRDTLNNIPPEFLADATLVVKKQAVPTETDIDTTFENGQIGSSVEMDNTTQSQKIDKFLGVEFPITLTEEVITPDGQIGEVTITLSDQEQTLEPHDPTQIEGNIDNLGGGLSVKRETVVSEVFPNKLFAKERPEIVPQAFRAELPTETTRIDTEGIASMPTLDPGDIARSSEETKVGVRRDSVSTRPPDVFPVTLTDRVLTPENQLGTRVRTLDDNDQPLTPDPKKIQGEVEAIGGGLFVKTEVTVPEVFPNEKFSIEKPDLVPQAFRGVVPTETTSSDSEGVAAMPSLGATDLQKTSEQIKEGAIRESTTTRPAASLPATLTDSVVTPQNQLGTRVRTLADVPQTVTPSPTLIEGSVEALGAGLTMKTEITVPEVFPNESFSKERPEVIPVAFRSAVPATTTRIDEAGTASMPTLSGSDIERTSEQIKEGVRRQTTRTRGALGTFPTITLRTWDNDLQHELIITMDIVAMGSSFTPGADVVDYDESEIDDVYSLRKVYKLPGGTLPTGYVSREPGSFYFPGLLTDVDVAIVALADTADGDPRGEVNWQPVWRPGFQMDVNFLIYTTFHTSAPAPDTQYVIRTNDIVFKGVSFQVSIPRVLNDAFSAGVAFSGDALYGDLSESFSVAASVPSASGYTVGAEVVVASKVTPWRRLWVKRTTKVILL